MIISNVLFAFGTTEADEPGFRDSFLAGYLLANGDSYTGNIHTMNDIIPTDPYSIPMYQYAINTNSYIIVRNSKYEAMEDSGDYYYNQGFQIVSPAGSNNYQSGVTISITYELVCGAGITENLTGYRISLFDIDPYALSGHISSVTQSAPNEITIVTDTNHNFYDVGYAVTISGVTGFVNSINGTKVITATSLGTTIKIAGTLGAGSYGGNGYVTLMFSSYSTPYIAGQLCGLVNRLNCSIFEAKYRLFITADPVGSSTINGYGKINLTNAIAYRGLIPADPYDTLTGTPVLSVLCVGGYCELTITGVSYALNYELYDRSELITTYPKAPDSSGYSGFGTMSTVITRGTSSQPHSFQVKALRGSQYSWSNVVNVPYNTYEKIIVNNNQ